MLAMEKVDREIQLRPSRQTQPVNMEIPDFTWCQRIRYLFYINVCLVLCLVLYVVLPRNFSKVGFGTRVMARQIYFRDNVGSVHVGK